MTEQVKKRTRKRVVKTETTEQVSNEVNQSQNTETKNNEPNNQAPKNNRNKNNRNRNNRNKNNQNESNEDNKPNESYRAQAKQQRRKESNDMERGRKSVLESDFLAERDNTDRKMLIDSDGEQVQIGIIEDKVLVEFYLSKQTDQTMVSNIYQGVVENVLPGMEACFVNIGENQNGILYSGETNWDASKMEMSTQIVQDELKPGDKVVVQVTKDPVAHKGPRLTSQWTISGKYVVLAPHSNIIGISRRIPEKERKRLKGIVNKFVPKGVGIIVRTASQGVSEQDIQIDVETLMKQYQDIQTKLDKADGSAKLYSEPGIHLRVLRDIANNSFNEIIVSKNAYDEVKDYIDKYTPSFKDNLNIYDGKQPLFKQYDIEDQLVKGLGRKVYLPSGGSLVIDQTEALTSIDINTGKFLGEGAKLEDTITKNNLEAAEEIVNQLRLRDIGGMIIIDFIDMMQADNKNTVLTRLIECLSRDRTRHQVSEITSLGLVQLTRKRRGPGLASQMRVVCDACKGTGFHHQQVYVLGSDKEKPKDPKAPKKPNFDIFQTVALASK